MAVEMELRAVAGLQHGGSCYPGFWSRSGGYFSTGVPRLRDLSSWGNPRFLGRRGARGGVLALKCSSEGGREADVGGLSDGRLFGGTLGDEDFDFWEYEASQHSQVRDVKDVRTEEGAEDGVAGEDVGVSDPRHVRPAFVVPKIKYTRESKGLKPTYRVFSRDRKTVPKPRINPYSVLMKIIDPANDDEYLDADLRRQSPEKIRDSESVAHDVDSSAVRASFDISEDSNSQDGEQDELGLDSVDEKENALVGDYNREEVVRMSDLWSDSDDEDGDFEDNDSDADSVAQVVKEEAADGEDPLRKFLNSLSGNRDSKQEGRVFKYNKAARKPDDVHSNMSELYRSESLASDKKKVNLHPVPTVDDGGGNQIETSAIREVLQIAYNLPENRVLEDYMAPFMNKFSSIQANLILEALCGDDLTDQALSFFRWMRLHDPCLWDSRSFSLLFTFLGRMGMPDQALNYFAMLPEDEQFHSVHIYNTLITCLTSSNRQDAVPPILEKMKALGSEPDAVTFSILMNSAVKGGRSVQEVWGLYQDMVERGVTPSVTAFGTLIKAFCEEGRLKEALLITTEMEKREVPSTVIIYNILINAYGKAGRLEEAEGLVSEMQGKGVQPNVATYNALVSGYLESNQFTVAEGLMEEMESLGLHPDVVTFTTLLGAYGHEGKADQAAQVFSRMEARGVQPNSHTYTALINAYSAGRWPEKAARAFEMMRRQGISPTVETFTALLDAYRRAGDLAMVRTVWKTMKDEGCVASRVTYMTILDAFQKQGRYKEARDLIEEFKNQGHKPDLMVYNMLLNSYMRGGRHSRAPDIVQEMKEAGFLPDSFTYCTLIYGFLRVRDHTKALKFHREMLNRAQLPDAKTYAKLRAILKAVEGRRDVNNFKSLKGKPSKPPKKGSEKAKSYWKREK